MIRHLACIFLLTGAVYGCEETEYSCAGGHVCIPAAQKCDGTPHCPMGEDEVNCHDGKVECSKDQFKCHTLPQCVDQLFVCDGHYDCHDSSDEYYCPEIRKHHSCNPGHFMCKEGTCIPDVMQCDGEPDCMDGEDEAQCENVEIPLAKIQVAGHVVSLKMDRDCPAPNIRCNDTQRTCIPARHFCDGENDCLDGSDEVGCGIALEQHECKASEGKYACKAKNEFETSIMCLNTEQLCDGLPHCPAGDDEGEFCGKKDCDKYGCEQNCMQSATGPSCYCSAGYTLAKDGKSCQDVDECMEFGFCSQLCHNTKGSYECACSEGYVLDGTSSCKYVGSAQLLIALEDTYDHGEIRSLDLHTGDYLETVADIKKPVGVAYDYLNRKLIWTDAEVGRPVIETAELRQHGKVAARELLLETGLELPEDLAVHEASGLVFFTDSHKGHVAVCSVVKDACAIISRGHQQPRGLAVHQADRLLFVTEWGSLPMVVQMNLDGSGRREIVKTDIKWPNGIAVDETTNRLYWADAERNTIESATVDGADRRLIIEDVHHPFGVAVFEDRLFWSDWREFSIYSCNKFTGNNLQSVLVAHSRINGLSVMHSLPNLAPTPCDEATAACSHLCIPTANSYVCKCPDDMELDFDDATCLPSKTAQNSLIMAVGNNLLGLAPQHLGKISLKQVGFETGLVAGLSSEAYNGDLLAYTNTSEVFHINTKLRSSNLVSSSLADMRSLAYDVDSLNLFWVDEQEKSIKMMSQQTKHTRTLAHGEDPKALIFIADLNWVVYIDGNKLLETRLDGHHTRVLTEQLPSGASLLSYADRTFYIAGSSSIHSYVVGNNYVKIVINECAGRPVSMAVQDGYLYWTEAGSNYLSWTSIKSHEVDQTVYKLQLKNPNNHPIFISSMTTKVAYGKPCLYYGCSDICIRLDEDSARCLCGDDRTLVKDDQFNTCKGSSSLETGQSGSLTAGNLASTIGVIVSLSVLFVCLLVIIVVLCCIHRRRPFKAAEFINRSFGLTSSHNSSLSKPNGQSVQVSRNGTLNEVENPGFCAVELETHDGGETTSETARILEKEEKENLLSRMVKKFNSIGSPKMCAMDWNDTVGYENMGSSTPSLRRMYTIEESDSAYTDLSNSMDQDDVQSNRNLVL